MKQKENYGFMCYLWLLVPVLSLVRLSRRVIDICMDNGPSGTVCVAMPTKAYNGLQLLLHGKLVNDYNSTVVDMSNPSFVILKIMIALQLFFDVTILFLCVHEWRKKQRTKNFLRVRGMLSIGYVLTSLAIYRFITVCSNHLQVERYHAISQSSYIHYYVEELENNILFSIAVVVLFLVTWSFFNRRKAYRRMCYFWIIVPILSLIILSRPMIVIETDDIYPITDVEYSGFQMLAYGSLTNEYKDLVIDRENLGFVIIKIMIALQLAFGAILIIIAFWEWRKKQNPKCFLCFRGGLTAGYVLTAVAIYRVAAWWSDNLEIEHDLDSFLTRASYAFGDWGVYVTLKFAIAIVVLFAVSLLAFCLGSKKGNV